MLELEKTCPLFVLRGSLRKVRDGSIMKTKIRPSFPSVNKNRTNVKRLPKIWV